MKTLQRLCSDDPEVLDLIDRATQGKHGGDRKSKEIKNNIVKLDNTQIEPPVANNRAYALRRLRRSRPDLHAKVLSGKLIPNAAMVKAGFRRKTITLLFTVS